MNLVVNDDYIKSMGKFLKDSYKELNDVTVRYMEILQGVLDKGIVEGKPHDSLEEFIEQVRCSSSQSDTSATSAGKKYRTFCEQYIEHLDDADEDLY